MTPELAKKIEKHDVEIEVLKHSFDKVVSSIDENTKSNHELIKTLAIYTTKHDGLESRMEELRIVQTNIVSSQIDHSNKIAEMKPTVDALKNLVWKLATATVLAGGGLATIIITLTKAKGG